MHATPNSFKVSLELGYYQFKMQNVGFNFVLLVSILIDSSIWDQFDLQNIGQMFKYFDFQSHHLLNWTGSLCLDKMMKEFIFHPINLKSD